MTLELTAPAGLARVRDRIEDLAQTALAAGQLGLEWLASGRVFNPLAKRPDPYPFYRSLRERDPVHRSHLIGGWVLLRHDDVSAVLRDPRFSNDDRHFYRYPALRERLVRRRALDVAAADRPSMLRLDPPDHTRLRALVQKSFTPRAIQALRPRIEALVERLLDALAGRPSIELMADLAVPLPVILIAELLGVPPEDRAQFKLWSAALAESLGQAGVEPVRRSGLAFAELRGYFEKVMLERQQQPQADLLSELLSAEEQGDRLSRPEVFAMLTLLLVAGNETTTNLIGNAVVALLQHPEQLERLRRDPDAIEAAVDEVLRYDSPVQATVRIPLEDVQIGARTLRRGEQLLLLLGAANRDPERFPQPDRFDIDRGDRGHLSFGLGRHFCLGAALARLEARVALAGLLRRYERIELAARDVDWARGFILRGPRSLRLQVAPAALQAQR